MNDELYTYLKKAGEEISLSHEERERMRRVIHAYMEMKPLRQPASSPRATWNLGWALSPRLAALSLIVAVFVSSAGLSYAAEGALPGDLLYPIKTHVNEPVAGALAISTSAKAEWAMGVAGQRVKEAATLAAEGRLSTTTQEALQVNFQEHAEEVADAINTTASTSPNTSDAAAVRFEAQLSEYADVLAQVGAAKDVPVDSLASSVEAQRQNIIAIRAHAHAYISATGAARTVAVSSMRAAAQEGLNASAGLANSASKSISASSAQLVAFQLQGASDTIQAGDNFADKNATPDAINEFQNALGAAEKIGVFLQTSSAIHARTGFIIGQPATTTQDVASSNKHGGGSKGRGNQPQITAAFSSATTSSVEVSASTTAGAGTDQENITNNQAQPASEEGQGENQTFSPGVPPTLPLSVPLPSPHKILEE
jgi:hypothetical protein